MPVKLDRRAHLKVKVGEFETLALVDTGATWSIIPKVVLEKLFSVKRAVKGIQNLENVSSLTASFDQIKFLQKANIHFKIDYLS